MSGGGRGPVSLQIGHGPREGRVCVCVCVCVCVGGWVTAGKEGGTWARWRDPGGAGACRPLCITQFVGRLGSVSAEQPREPRGIIIYDGAQRYLPGTGMGWAPRSVDGKLNSNFLLHGLRYTPQSAGTRGSPA